ncbi:chromatin remodeling complex subunit [Coprinopsis marcescibilis]|uniref:Chromatin remodeling complex subunit n=1 Tax=Coprinopsis marcescibilis TaxID=230819 RepID=A0A5C3L6S0_COPMA|nr:chromatin remodeling complex subunit [Coprinopsis marcescibilis]
MDATENIVRLPIYSLPTQPLQQQLYDPYRDTGVPLIIDNGATTLRWGFATSSTPFSGQNAIAKYKERKTNKPLLLFGEGIDTESGARSQARAPWEGDVLLNFDALENALDYAFIQLGIDTPTINHPVFMTERIATPLHSRALTSELMFELYSVPSLTFCTDGLASFYQNHRPQPGTPFTSDGLVLSFNTASTSVIPILNGKGILSHAKRIPWGAAHASDYLLKLIQLKYPNFPSKIGIPQTNWMLQSVCEFAPDYPAKLRELQDPIKLKASERIVQFPFALPVQDEKSEEELARAAERRREQGRKLQEIAAKNRMEKLAQKETDLQYLLDLREARSTDSKREWASKLQSEGFDSDTALDDTIKKLELYVKKARKKEAGEADEPMEEPSFPLIDTPDADLDEEQLKDKKKQKLIKAGWEARMRARKEKEREREEKEREEKREEEERLADLEGWASHLRHQQQALMSKIKARSRRKAALTDRKSAAAQARMKNIANLAADDNKAPKKKRKTGGEDMFGADDADWQIYRKISITAPSSDEEDDITQLQVIENKLLAHDPTFTDQNTHAFLTTQRSALLSAFRPTYEEGDIEGHTRIHLSVERWRVPETYFSPNMAGIDSAGIDESIQNIFNRFSESEKARLVKNIFLTGTPSQLPGIIPRLHNSLRPILDPDIPIQIVRAADPSLDAWKGMASFSQTPEAATAGVTRAEYDEYGPERIKRWWGGNWNGSV